MKKCSIVILLISLSLLISCDKNYDLKKYMVGKWAVVGSICSENGSCKNQYSFQSKAFYTKNYNSTVLEFRTNSILYQPILGEGKYETEKNSVKLGINLEGKTVWSSAPVNVISRDQILIKFGKVWRKYRRIQ